MRNQLKFKEIHGKGSNTHTLGQMRMRIKSAYARKPGSNAHYTGPKRWMKHNISVMRWHANSTSQSTLGEVKRFLANRNAKHAHRWTLTEQNPRSIYRRRRTAVSTVFSGGTGGDP